MAIKVTKKVKDAMALYHKINVIRSTFYIESFMLFSKVHNFWTMLPYYCADDLDLLKFYPSKIFPGTVVYWSLDMLAISDTSMQSTSCAYTNPLYCCYTGIRISNLHLHTKWCDMKQVYVLSG